MVPRNTWLAPNMRGPGDEVSRALGRCADSRIAIYEHGEVRSTRQREIRDTLIDAVRINGARTLIARHEHEFEPHSAAL